MSSEDVLLASIGPSRAPVLVKLRKWKGLRLFDVRKYFTTNGELKPTRKGISLRTNGVEGVRHLLATHYAEVRAFLEGADNLEELVYSGRLSEEQAAVEQLRFGRREVEVEVSNVGKGHLFHIRSSGARDTVTLSKEHPFAAVLAERAEVAAVVSELLSAYARARELMIADEEEASLFAELEYTWARILGSSGLLDE